ncbi:MAG TPA: START-like domain-containing protein [Bacteroidia bacterium]|nr:START-like domain-containing protein [Bacteroidia bacterium]HNT80121.1 START-like domain-containing protein [Bacteroidia bacterium]
MSAKALILNNSMAKNKSSGKKKFNLEFEMRSSPRILFNYLSTASGLQAWFADNVIVQDGNYIFQWQEEDDATAEMINNKDNQSVRFKWVNEDEEVYTEFEIITDDITSDVGLMITDFAESEDLEEAQMIWEAQVDKLRNVLGS